MRHPWRLCRTFQAHRDGQRRGERAYQLLRQGAPAPAGPPPKPGQRPGLALHDPVAPHSLAVTHGRSALWPGLTPAAHPAPDH
jgi:hypothetical protein